MGDRPVHIWKTGAAFPRFMLLIVMRDPLTGSIMDSDSRVRHGGCIDWKCQLAARVPPVSRRGSSLYGDLVSVLSYLARSRTSTPQSRTVRRRELMKWVNREYRKFCRKLLKMGSPEFVRDPSRSD